MKAASSWRLTFSSSAFIASGRLIVSVPMPSAISDRTSAKPNRFPAAACRESKPGTATFHFAASAVTNVRARSTPY